MPMLVVLALYVSMISSASLFHFIAQSQYGHHRHVASGFCQWAPLASLACKCRCWLYWLCMCRWFLVPHFFISLQIPMLAMWTCTKVKRIKLQAESEMEVEDEVNGEEEDEEEEQDKEHYKAHSSKDFPSRVVPWYLCLNLWRRSHSGQGISWELVAPRGPDRAQGWRQECPTERLSSLKLFLGLIMLQFTPN